MPVLGTTPQRTAPLDWPPRQSTGESTARVQPGETPQHREHWKL